MRHQQTLEYKCAKFLSLQYNKKMYNNQRIYIVVGSVTGLSVAVYLVYRYIKANGCSSNSAEIRTSRPARIEVTVPRKYIGSIVGRGGCIIKAIERETGTKISMKREKETEEVQVFEIRGAPENAQLVETKFLNILETVSKIETEEIFIPHNACGKVIGKNGQRIRAMTNASKARIKVDGEVMNEQGQHKVTIIGTREQIENAKSMIHETISPVTKGTHKSFEAASSGTYKYASALLGLHEGFMEVFVSAMKNPSRFWIQVVGVKSLELDNLVQEMARYYAEPSNCIQHRREQVLVGDLVASPYGKDKKWYRAKVIEVAENEDKLTLFYLDYGDTANIAKTDVLELDVQFQKLHFQAIECRLAKAIPESGEWSDAAKEFFRKLCGVAEWKTLEAKIMNWHDLKFEEGREIVLAVELYDRENGKNIRISEELVKKGFAKFKGQVLK